MEPILRLVHGLSLPHFTHFTVRYSDLSSFPYSSCQTRQEASDGGTLLLPLCFGPFYVGLISGYVVQLYYHNISACQHLNAKFLTVGIEPTFPSKLRIVSYPTPLRDFSRCLFKLLAGPSIYICIGYLTIHSRNHVLLCCWLHRHRRRWIRPQWRNRTS